MNYYDVCIYLNNTNDVEIFGITKEIIESFMYKRFLNNSEDDIRRVMVNENLFFLMGTLSSVEFKIPFFFIEKIKFFKMFWDRGRVVLKCIVPTYLFNEYQEFLDSKNIGYTWKDT